MKKEEVLMLIGVILSGLIAYFSGPQRWWFLGMVSAFAAVSYWLFSRQKASDSRWKNVVLELIGPEKDVYVEVQQLHKKGYHLGRYRFLEELQDNSYQGVTTFLANSSYGKVVVKKWEGKGEKGHANQLARFLRGAVLARSISHPRISRVLEIGVSRKKWEAYTVLEYIEGETLDQILQANPQGLAWEEALKFLRQILDGLSEFHKKGIIHRDIKPANVVINRKGEVTLIDFGLVKEVGDFQLSLSREGIGTLDYAAPEQLQGEKALVGMRSDLFSVGVILYKMLDGLEPYLGMDLRQKKRLEPRLIQKTGVPPYLRDLAYRLVSYDPMDRFGGVEQVV